MSLFDSYWVSIFAGFSAFMLGLSILVQVLQEIYKALTSSKARAYTRALRGYFGDPVDRLLASFPGLAVRKPWPLKNGSDKKLLLPMDEDRLVAALNKIVSEQDPKSLEIRAAADGYNQFVRNFDYTYKRRNLRQTFVIAFLLVFAVDLPVWGIYQKARALSPEDTAALAEKYVNLYEELTKKTESSAENPGVETTIQTLAALKDQALAGIEPLSAPGGSAQPDLLVNLGNYLPPRNNGSLLPLIRHLVGCLVTALLVCFGAPVWNDLATIFFRLQKGKNGSSGSNGAAVAKKN